MKSMSRRLIAPTLILGVTRAVTLAITFAATWGSVAAQAQEAPHDCQGTPSATWLRVAVAGLRDGNGLVAVSIYPDDASRFLAHHGSLFTARVPAHAGTTQVCVFLPRPGVYGIATYHDENASRKLDRTAFGLPAEGFGFSNNPATFVGIPSFASVRLQVSRTDLGTRIALRYP